MANQGRIFANAFTLEQMENRYKKSVPGIFLFWDLGCCIDTTPPIPGTGN